LAKALGVTGAEIKEGLERLEQNLLERGIRLVKKENEFMLSTSPESSEFTQALIKEEVNANIGKSGLEVLSVVLYRGPVKRSDIDYVRGVNSTYTLRNLMVRGLVERVPDPKDSRSFIYKPSFQLLQYLGVGKIEDLPEFDQLNEKVADFVIEQENNLNKEKNDDA
jgi:segregation and condensation protein B